MENLRDFVKNANTYIQSRLGGRGVQITKEDIPDDTYFESLVWYAGNEEDLLQLYKRNNKTMKFWGCAPSSGQVRRIHSDIPRRMIDIMASITASGLNEITIDDKNLQAEWDEIEEQSGFKMDFEEIIADILLFGFGAFKIYFNEGSNIPALKWFTYPDCTFKREKNKKIEEVIFKTPIQNGEYIVHEIYRKGAIEVRVYKKGSKRPIPRALCPSEAEVFFANECHWDGDFSLAVPVAFKYSRRHPGYPEGAFAGKFESFDFIDECFSKLPEEMRKGGIHTYIPDALLINPSAPPNPFDNSFIKTAGTEKQNGEDKITVTSEQIQYEVYYNSYMMAVDVAIQGYMSRYTLAYDTAQTENAEAQREKEKTTLYTRKNIIKIMTRVIEQVVRTVLAAQQTAIGAYNADILRLPVSTDFDEYAAPDFDSVVATVSKAMNLMSIEARVEELWGDSKTEEWKQEEIKRLKIEQGLVSGIETQVMDYDE